MELPPPAKGSAQLPFPVPPPLKAVLLDVELPISLVRPACWCCLCGAALCALLLRRWSILLSCAAACVDGTSTAAAHPSPQATTAHRNTLHPSPPLRCRRRARCGWRCSTTPPRCWPTSTRSWAIWTSGSAPGAARVRCCFSRRAALFGSVWGSSAGLPPGWGEAAGSCSSRGSAVQQLPSPACACTRAADDKRRRLMRYTTPLKNPLGPRQARNTGARCTKEGGRQVGAWGCGGASWEHAMRADLCGLRHSVAGRWRLLCGSAIQPGASYAQSSTLQCRTHSALPNRSWAPVRATAEVMEAVQLSAQGFTLRTRCTSEGVPFSSCFANHVQASRGWLGWSLWGLRVCATAAIVVWLHAQAGVLAPAVSQHAS